MSKFSEFLNNLNLKSIIAINIFSAILIFIPLTLVLSQRQTKITGKAFLPAPTVVLLPPSPTPTPPLITPSGTSEITSVNPFYGKVGDSVIIYGKNFGSQKDLVFFGNIPTTEIKSWQDNKIHALVPAGATSGLIKIKIASLEYNTKYNFIVFDKNIFCELLFESLATKKTLGLKNCPLISRVKFVLKTPDPDFNFPLSTIPPLAAESLKVKKITLENQGVVEAEVSLPGNILFEKILVIEAPVEKRITLVSAELWQENNLIPFFINPLSLIK